MNQNKIDLKKCPDKGHFYFLTLLCFVCLLLIFSGKYGIYQIETQKRGQGYTGIRVGKNGVFGWNLYSGILEAKLSETSYLFKIPGYPIEIKENDQTGTLFLTLYLNNKFAILHPEIQELSILETEKSDRIPASFLFCNQNSYAITFRSQPKGGVKKKFPYYMPILNRFYFSLTEIDEKKLIEKGWDEGKGKSEIFWDTWHEESTGVWKAQCGPSESILLLNPNAEKLMLIDPQKKRLIWESETGHKPTVMVFRSTEGKIYVTSPQMKSIDVYQITDGRKTYEFPINGGWTSAIDFDGKIYGLNPYRRKIEYIDPTSGERGSVTFETGIPAALDIDGDKLIVSDSTRWGGWKLEKDLTGKQWNSIKGMN